MPRPPACGHGARPLLSVIWLSFMDYRSISTCASHLRQCGQGAATLAIIPRTAGVSARVLAVAQFVEAEADQRRPLAPSVAAAGCESARPSLSCRLVFVFAMACTSVYSALLATTSRSRRRAMISLTFLPRRAATLRGLVSLLQGIERRPHHVVGIGRPLRLRHDILHAEVSNTARIGPPAMMPVPAGAARSTTLPAPHAADHIVMQRPALPQRNPDQPALGALCRLADRFRHLACLAVAEADAALLVSDHHQRRETEPPAALHHLRHAIDVNELVEKLAVAIFPVAVAFASLCAMV